MKKIILIFSITFLISCNSKKETIKGDLYFKLVNIISSEGMSDQEVEQLKQTLHNLENDTEEKELFTYFKKLDDQKLLGLPHIMLKESDGEPKQIFISKKEYEKIKKFTFDYLKTNHKKVTLELELKSRDGIFYSDNIIDIKESDGETLSSK